VFDILLTTPMLLLALPAVALAAFLIKLIDPGPAFYLQKRIGRQGQIVAVLKLRTMCVDSERLLEEHLSRDPQARAEWQRYFKLRDDPRILPLIGNFLRHFSVDELPQLWNVIRGDMSLIGPRPLPPIMPNSLTPNFRHCEPASCPESPDFGRSHLAVTVICRFCGRRIFSTFATGRRGSTCTYCSRRCRQSWEPKVPISLAGEISAPRRQCAQAKGTGPDRDEHNHQG
jgi:ribosomal protein L37E